MLRPPRLLIPLALLASLATSVAAQTGQYTAPGALGIHPIDAREALRAAVDEARWRLGPVRLDPWIGVRDIAWVENEGEDGDLTVSVGAGLRAYLPVGSRVVFTAHALPEYIWWRDRDEESRVGGRGGLGMFLHANRFGLEVKASSSDLDEYATPEVQRRAEVDAKSLEARLDVPIGRRISLFGRGGRGDFAVAAADPAPAELSDLDRVETWVEGGVRLLFGRGLSIGFGAGERETEFDDTARDRSNDGSYTLGEITWTRTKLAASLTVRQLELSGTTPASEFVELDDTTWRAQISWSPRRRSSLAVYGQEDLVYSVVTPDAYFFDERVGIRAGLPVGSRLALIGYFEDGEHRYAGGRVDDVVSWGGGVDVPLGRRLRLSFGYRSTEIDGDSGRREVSELNFRASLGADGLSWE